MPGPPPKDPEHRQRRNVAATRAELPAQTRRRGRVPQLPERPKPAEGEAQTSANRPWHARTLAWWKDLWASPMAPKFTRADVHELHVLAELRDRFHYGEHDVAGELRLQSARFGLTPVDRWRLQWDVVGDALPRPRVKAPAATPAPAAGADASGAAPTSKVIDRRKLFLRGA